MKTRKETKKEYIELMKLVEKAEKKAVEFVKKNISNDSELQLKNRPSQGLSLQ